MREVFDQFIRERRFLKAVSDQTVNWYNQSYSAFRDILEDKKPSDLSKGVLLDQVEKIMNRRVRPVTINSYARCLNAFLNWTVAEGMRTEPLRIPKLKEESKVLATWSPDQVKKLQQFKSEFFAHRRAQVLALLILDTGMRLSEALNLKKDDFDFENLLLKIRVSKGKKQRVVPFSDESRRVLYRFFKDLTTDSFVFAAVNGQIMNKANARRDLSEVTQSIPIKGIKPGFHILRHSFATNFLKSGGDVFTLQRILGHSNLEVTRRYCQFDTSDLQVKHRTHGFFK